MPFLEAVAAMARLATVEQVGLVIRWNTDDARVLTLWSESPDHGVAGGNPPVEVRPAMFRPNHAGWRSASKVSDIAGYHAEELMIACWPRLLAAVELPPDEVVRVDMVLSKSPCFGDKGSSPLKVVHDEVDSTYGSGCSRKLHEFISGKPRRIDWRLFYIALAGASATSYENLGYSGHRGLMTDEELELDMWRRLHVWYRDTIRPNMQGFADFWMEMARADTEEFTRIKLRLGTDKSLSGTAKQELVTALQAAQKKAKSDQRHATRIQTDVRDTMHEYRDRGRLTSLYQAQQGIQLLQSLVNVDVNRWRS